MPRAQKVCSCIGGCSAHKGSCPELTPAGRCPACASAAEQKRGSASSRGYNHHWQTVVRPRYLKAHPICVLCQGIAEVADHYPVSRRELVAAGVPDPDAWRRLRALCSMCHGRATAGDPGQRGGWNRR